MNTRYTDAARTLREVAWPCERLGEALGELLAHTSLPVRGRIASTAQVRGEALQRWLAHAARNVGVEGRIDTVVTSELATALQRPGPYLIVLDADGPAALGLAVLSTRTGVCVVLGPDRGEWTVELAELAHTIALRSAPEHGLGEIFAGLRGGPAALQRLREHDAALLASCLVVRYGPDGTRPFLAQLWQAGVGKRAALYLLSTLVQGIVTALAAFTLGAAALTGLVDADRIVAWSLLIGSLVPLQYIATLLLGRAAIEIGLVFKKRLLEGALEIKEPELRAQGFGAIVARLNEASVVEQTNVAELFGVLGTLGQAIGALVLLSLGTHPEVFVPLWVVFAAGATLTGVAHQRRYRRCYESRLDLSCDLVEKTVGHRTRRVQADPARLHQDEDAALHDYARQTVALNRVTTLMEVYGRLWLCVAGGALLLAFTLYGNVTGLIQTSVGVFLGYTSFPAALAAARGFAAWLCAWRGVRNLFRTGARDERAEARASHSTDLDEAGRTTLVSNVSFGYRSHEVFSDVSLRIERGERVLLAGPSGGGKTTLSKLLTGELQPSSGTILVDGVDRASVPEAAWRQRVVSSPQFHENYVFSNTFAFNVDPRGAAGELSSEARQVCFELGLRELIGKMPSRAAQLLGETGWQLSHGEQSRVFIARSLLQGADLLIFDESFAALDPESLALALACVRKRAQTLMVIAHQ